jgi:(R,R)-butanediol dehydrogenase / meso-butanediol dehydrogenase / diacetyl reductase
MTMMRAAVYHAPGDVRIEKVREPDPGSGEVLIKVGAVGICGSDAAEYAQPRMIRAAPDGTSRAVVLGHEFAGLVAGLGPGVPGDLLGQPVACGAGISCGNCGNCARGRTNLCLTYHTIGFHRDGGMAEYVTAPASICVPVADRGLGLHTAALAQPMAIAVHARRRGQVSAGDVVLIIGVGGIGSFLVCACVAIGAEVWVADIADDRLALAGALGARHVIDSRTAEPADLLAQAGARADVIFEVSGTGAGVRSAFKAARPGVRLVAVGVQKAPYEAALSEWTLSEYDVLGTVAHVCAADMPAAIDLLADGDASTWRTLAPTVFPLDALIPEGLLPLGAGHPRQVKTLFDPAASAARPAAHTGKRRA